jgi:hypothetical protein
VPPKLTDAMKEFVLEQESIGNPPRIAWSKLVNSADVPVTAYGHPTVIQVGNYMKTLRRLGLSQRNELKAIKAFVKDNIYTPEIAPDKNFFFGYKLDIEGFPHVGTGAHDDPFILGVTNRNLVKRAVSYGNLKAFALFHVDATFKLSDIGYPVVTCGFSDSSRTYHLLAIFVCSQRRESDYIHMLTALANQVYNVARQPLRVVATMADAEDAQLNAFKKV